MTESFGFNIMTKVRDIIPSSANVSLCIISLEIMQPSPGWCINIDRRYLSNERMIENVFEYQLAFQSETVNEDAMLISTVQRDVIESPSIRWYTPAQTTTYYRCSRLDRSVKIGHISGISLPARRRPATTSSRQRRTGCYTRPYGVIYVQSTLIVPDD